MLISVVIPTCHRNDLLAKCLEAVAPGRQRLAAADYEVIVTDDGRRETAQEMMRRDYPWARWVAGPKDGPAANRNNGARNAAGDWIAFTDDDCIPDSGWLEAIARVAREGRVDVIEGRTIIPDKVDSPFKQGVENHDGDSFWSCNLAVRRAAFEGLGGFDEDFKEAADEDMEFAWRFRQRGHPHCFVHDALVLHPVRTLGWAQIWKRTKMARWHELLFLKTGRSAPLGASSFVVVLGVVRWTVVTLLRTTWHLFTRKTPEGWRTRLFWQWWRWVTFLFVTPYIAVWNLRYRKMLVARQQSQRSFN
jgi:GT2 family glycosyltransferase